MKIFPLGAVLLLAAGWVGCADIAGEGGITPLPSENLIFPHPEGWKEFSSHGAFVKKNGKQMCQSACHGEDLKGGSTGKSCNDCHSVYPHVDDWKKEHRTFLDANGGTAVCRTACHGTDLAGCSTCHAQYPHSENWLDQHPEIAHSVTTDEAAPLFDINVGDSELPDCTGTCHNQEGGISRTCRDCHQSGVHEEGWDESSQHGLKVLSDGTDRCVRCHGTDLSGGALAPSCKKCHTSFPHPTQWAASSEAESHPEFVRQNGFGDCKGACHGTDFQGGDTGRSCGGASCHNRFPHEAETWRTSHDDTFLSALLAGEERPCLGCHGDDYTGGPSKKSCDSCHRRSHIPDEWIGYDKHGTAYRTDREAGTQRCTNCHGNTIRFDTTYTGVAAAPAGQAPLCYQCHAMYPHLSYKVNGSDVDWKSSHLVYIMLDRNILHGGNLSDLTLIQSIRNTCGATAGCHTGGRYSTPRNNQPACTQVCHRPSR